MQVVRRSVMLRCQNFGVLLCVPKLLTYVTVIIVLYTDREFTIQSSVTVLGLWDILRTHISYSLPQGYQQFQEMVASIRRMQVRDQSFNISYMGVWILGVFQAEIFFKLMPDLRYFLNFSVNEEN